MPPELSAACYKRKKRVRYLPSFGRICEGATLNQLHFLANGQPKLCRDRVHSHRIKKGFCSKVRLSFVQRPICFTSSSCLSTSSESVLLHLALLDQGYPHFREPLTTIVLHHLPFRAVLQFLTGLGSSSGSNS